uniref:Translocase of chloroplast 159/132 membrane anchor domain-containing protein n=1 Tax=Populus alba TaxID=43335 RepID=A0A4U5P4V7_POPAL|nr:hypothetical protein D5086_0000233080 [Populus alba]
MVKEIVGTVDGVKLRIIDTPGYGDIGEAVDQEDVGPATVPVAMPDFVLPPSFDSDNPSYSLERNIAVAGQFPGAFAVRITKDSSVCAKYGGNGSTVAGFDIQNVGRQLAHILTSEK